MLEIIAKLGIREVYGMELVEKRMIPIYELKNNRKVISDIWKGKELAIAILEYIDKPTQLMIKTSRGIKYVSFGDPLEAIKNVVNLGVNDIYNTGTINEWSIHYPYNVLPIFKNYKV